MTLEYSTAQPAGLLAVKAKGITRHFDEHVALDAIDLEMREGEFVALVGKSGSGKTTLLRILAGLDSPDGGTLLVPEARTVVFQEPRLVQSKRVWRNVNLGLRRGVANKTTAEEALRVVNLEHRVNAWPATLSGGEAQRVALARALVRQPKLLLLDEPFAALDALTRLQMHQLIRELIERFTPATLLVTHDVDEALLLADRVIVLRDGKLATEIVPTDPFPRHPVGPVFTETRRNLLGELGVEI
ncbi:MAG: ABC transporter ATP-binding protein [Acidimicrobiales bacterium]|jgi:sulfonate transport system ATP-binding protein